MVVTLGARPAAPSVPFCPLNRQNLAFLQGWEVGVDGGNPWGQAGRSVSPLLSFASTTLGLLIIVRALLV